MIKKTTQFRQLLQSDQLEFIMEAHNGLSAKIVAESGFKGIWGSGLAISAAMGVRDNNEASWTQVMEVIEFMSDATNIPILLDADTGGNVIMHSILDASKVVNDGDTFKINAGDLDVVIT